MVSARESWSGCGDLSLTEKPIWKTSQVAAQIPATASAVSHIRRGAPLIRRTMRQERRAENAARSAAPARSAAG